MMLLNKFDLEMINGAYRITIQTNTSNKIHTNTVIIEIQCILNCVARISGLLPLHPRVYTVHRVNLRMAAVNLQEQHDIRVFMQQGIRVVLNLWLGY